MEINKEHQHYIFSTKERQYVTTFQYFQDAMEYLMNNGNDYEIHIVFGDAVRFVITSKYCIPARPLIMGKHPSIIKKAAIVMPFYFLAGMIALRITELTNSFLWLFPWVILYTYLADKYLKKYGTAKQRLWFLVIANMLILVFTIFIKPMLLKFMP